MLAACGERLRSCRTEWLSSPCIERPSCPCSAPGSDGAGWRETHFYPCHYAETLGRAGPMTEPSSSARVGLVIAAGWSVSGQDGAAKSPYAAVLDWAWTHYRILNQGSRVGPAEPGGGRRWTGMLLQVGEPGARTARRREATCMDARRSLEGRARCARTRMDS